MPTTLTPPAKRIGRILTILERTYPNAACSLRYRTPLELLVATILSAQCTDVLVNKVTPELFTTYRSAKAYAGALRKQMAQFVGRQPRVSVDIAGDPIEGNPSGELQIVEFSDFLCPSCQRASQFNPLILAGRMKTTALVFKNFPLDQTCQPALPRTVHQGACQIAAAGECAFEQGNEAFWKFHNRVFETGPNTKVSELESDAAAAGLNMDAFRACVSSGRGMQAVQRDVAEGVRLKISSTPTYVINGVPTSGILTPAMFDEFVAALRNPAPAAPPSPQSPSP